MGQLDAGKTLQCQLRVTIRFLVLRGDVKKTNQHRPKGVQNKGIRAMNGPVVGRKMMAKIVINNAIVKEASGNAMSEIWYLRSAKVQSKK